jgi:hypothetical protein
LPSLVSPILFLPPQELSETSPASRPLRRRVAALIGAWVARVESGDRPTLYRALLGMMAEQDVCMKVRPRAREE